MLNNWKLLFTKCSLDEKLCPLFDDVWSFYQRAFAKHNFTAIRDKEGFEIKHLIDSIFPFKELAASISFEGKSALDIGAGGGFPSLPLALLYPKIKFLLLDSLKKNINLIDQFCEEFMLKNVATVCGRAEDLGKKMEFREKFDLVMARAFANWPITLELAAPFIKDNGYFFGYFGPGIDKEIDKMFEYAKKFSLEEEMILTYALPLQMGERRLVVFKKSGSTNSMYPRKINIIKRMLLN